MKKKDTHLLVVGATVVVIGVLAYHFLKPQPTSEPISTYHAGYVGADKSSFVTPTYGCAGCWSVGGVSYVSARY